MLNVSLKCAVIGLGVGNQHALAFMKHPQAQLVAIAEHDQAHAQNFVKKHAAHNIQIMTFDQIMADKNINVVSIASYDEDHYEQVIACLENGKHIFVEKPLCQTSEELDQIVAKWNGSSCALASNLVLRNAPLYQWLKNLIQSGDMGDIYAFDGDYLYGRMEKIISGWRAETENYSVMEGGGIHIIDLMMMLTGQKPTTVQSLSNKIATAQTAFRYHDFHSSHFAFESGLIGRITANFGCVHKHHHIIRIFGTKATFIYDDMGPRIHWSRGEDKKAEILNYSPLPKGKGILIPDFIESIAKNDIKSRADQEFGLMSVVLSADQALKEQTPVKINYLK